MGTIRTAIALYDGVTSPLQSMHKAMGVVLNTFEAMQQASGRAVGKHQGPIESACG